ncbi:MAG: PDZ domain-containing protein, partial [Candidatus Hydrogenedentes bacterium]|nr:PDZ domain-containing protein [Candidatus Hydrogenedentota bacterium]
FAIPINMVKYVTDQLMENGEVVRGFLGISIQDLDAITSQYFDGVDQGVLVAGVIDDTPAAKAGLLRDDVIIELNGKPATNAGTFKSRVSIIAPGDTANLVIIRDGKKITKKVTIAARPTDLGSSGGGQTGGSKGKSSGVSKSKSIGVTVQNLTEDLAERFEFESTEGVVITKVTPNSPAARAGLRPGMLIQEVNRQTITNTDDFNAALEDQEEAKSILLLVTEGEYSRYIPLKMK